MSEVPDQPIDIRKPGPRPPSIAGQPTHEMDQERERLSDKFRLPSTPLVESLDADEVVRTSEQLDAIPDGPLLAQEPDPGSESLDLEEDEPTPDANPAASPSPEKVDFDGKMVTITGISEGQKFVSKTEGGKDWQIPITIRVADTSDGMVLVYRHLDHARRNRTDDNYKDPMYVPVVNGVAQFMLDYGGTPATKRSVEVVRIPIKNATYEQVVEYYKTLSPTEVDKIRHEVFFDLESKEVEEPMPGWVYGLGLAGALAWLRGKRSHELVAEPGMIDTAVGNTIHVELKGKGWGSYTAVEYTSDQDQLAAQAAAGQPPVPAATPTPAPPAAPFLSKAGFRNAVASMGKGALGAIGGAFAMGKAALGGGVDSIKFQKGTPDGVHFDKATGLLWGSHQTAGNYKIRISRRTLFWPLATDQIIIPEKVAPARFYYENASLTVGVLGSIQGKKNMDAVEQVETRGQNLSAPWLHVDPISGTITATPPPGTTGAISFEVHARNGQIWSDWERVSIPILPAPPAPPAAPQPKPGGKKKKTP